MSTTVNFNGTNYSIPSSSEINWGALSSFLVDVGTNAATSTFQKATLRVATTSPVTVLATSDYAIVTKLSVAGAVAVNLPAGVLGQMFCVVDGTGDAATNNVTITPASGNINGSSTYVIDGNRNGVVFAYSGTEWVILSEFIASSSGFIPRSQIAVGTADHVVINSGTGALSSEAQLAKTRGGTGVSSTATFPSSGVVVTEAATETLTNKDISSATNTYRDASTTVSGAVSTGTQTFTGTKTFSGATSTGAIIPLTVSGYESGAGPDLRINTIAGRGTAASPAALNSADQVIDIEFRGYYDTTNVAQGAGIVAKATAAWTSSTAHGAKLIFQTAPNSGSANVVDRLTIDQDGSVTIAGAAADQVVINSSAGAFSSEAQLAKTRGGTGITSTATFPASGVVVTEAAAETLTNKTISGASNTITNVSLTTGVTGTLPLANGGTNATTKAGAFDSLSPMTTAGDTIYGGTAGTGTRLAPGTSAQVLHSGTTPTWGAVSLTADVSGTLPLGNGGTNATTKAGAFDSLSPMTTAGDVIYGGTAGTGTRLAAGTSTQVLHGGTTPTWGAISLTADVSGTLPLANGGTNATTKSGAFDSLSPMTNAGDLIYGGTSGTGTRLAPGTSGQYLKSTGTTAPAWTTLSTASLSDYTTGSFTMSASGPYVAANVTATYVLIGKAATLTIAGRRASGNSTASQINLDTTNLPAALRPSADIFSHAIVRDAGTDQQYPGQFIITATGSFIINKDANTTNFTSTAANVGFYTVTVAYVTA